MWGLPPLRKTVSPHVKNYDTFSRVFDSQSVAGTSLALFSAMNECQRVLFLKRELSRLFVRRLCNKQSNTWFLGDMEFFSSCSTRYFTSELNERVRY